MKSLPNGKIALKLTCAGTMAALLALASPAQAQDPSPNAMVNLIRLLVEQKVITQAAGDALLAQAETEAQAAQAKLAAAAPPPPPADGAVRVPYVPQVVKDQIRDEVRQEVLAQAKTEGWATPGNVPDWVRRVKMTGDVRFRSQSALFARTNANDFIDFQRFNLNGPTDYQETADANTLPLLNTREDRISQLSIRARLGIEADLVPGVRAGIRLASGQDNGPVSTTGLLGGGFGKKNIWLDQAFIAISPTDFATVTFGRMPNPFVSGGQRTNTTLTNLLLAGSRDPSRFGVSDLIFDEDINFDGVAMTLDSGGRLGSGLNLAVTGGAFPFEQLGDDDPVTAFDKTDAPSKWIFGGQARLAWNAEDFGAKLGVGYFDFYKVRGQISEPCLAYVGQVDCSTDYTRPAFVTRGNTLMYLRQIVADPSNRNFYPKPQFVGLVGDYNVLEVTGQLYANVSDDIRVSINGSYVKNLVFDRKDICANQPFGIPLTNVTGVTVSVPATTGGRTNVLNFNPCAALENSTSVDGGPLLASYDSGDTAWMVQGWVGSKGLRKGGEWSLGLGYKRIEPDAVLDSLADSDFHLGGTNAQGYIVTGNYMLFDNLRITGRYLSANEIYGNPLAIDVLQIDLVAAF